jgi:Zn-finger nucleic acid-binding protein
MATMRDLVCPKCGGRMRTYERSEMIVEQCEDCRGIFLDHGELERLVEAEGGGWSGRIAQPAAREEDRGGVSRDDRPSGHREDRPDPRDPRSTRRESRLGGLFDLFGGD